MRLLYAIYLAWLSAHDERELLDCCKHGSAGTAWAIRLRLRIDAMDRRVESLLLESRSAAALRKLQALAPSLTQLTRTVATLGRRQPRHG
jgi:hypothetical protein